jgi:putative ABC transport system permease protein
MLSLYSTLSVRYLRRRWFLAVPIVAFIALGVATLVATRALNETMTRAGLASLNPMAGAADLLVSNGEAPIDLALADELARVPGVAVALPRIFANGKVVDLGESPVLLLGVDQPREEKADADRQRAGRKLWEWTVPQSKADLQKWLKALPKTLSLKLLQQAWQKGLDALPVVIVGKELDARLPEDTKLLQLRVPGRKEPAEVVRIGTVEGFGPLAALGGNILVFRKLAPAAEMAGLKPGQVTRIDLSLRPGASRDEVKAAVASLLRGRAEVNTPEEKSQMISNVMSGMQTGFALSGLATLVVGLFLVYNALSVCVAERRHEIGILLSVGATRKQVRALFAGEAALLGVVGALLGIPLGVAEAYMLQPLVQGVLRDVFTIIEPEQIEVSVEVMLAAVAAGIVTAVAACLVPAIVASKEKPADAVRRVPPTHTWRFRILQVAASALLILLGVVLIFLRELLPQRVGLYGGLVMVLVGGLLATPLLAAIAAWLLQPAVRLLLGIEARLASDNLVRSPQRTGLVIAALAAGVALVMQTAGTIRSNREGFHEWVREFIGADLMVTSGSPVGAGGQSQPMAEELGRQIETQLKEVDKALPIRARKFPYHGTQIQVLALSADDFVRVNTPRHSPGLDLYVALSRTPDGAIVSENFAALHHVRTGDTIALASRGGEVHLRVLGQLMDYSWNHGTVLINRRDFLRHWDDHKVDIFDIYLRPGAGEETKKAVQATLLKRFGAQHGLFVQTREELQDYIDGAIDQLYAIAYSLQIMVMLVATLGVIMAFIISVLQRRREMGLLRAIGGSQAQVVRSVLAEAALMGVIGTAIGLLVGVPLEWFVLRVAFLEESGYLFAVHIPWTESLVIAAAAVGLATLAGLVPALFAVSQPIPEAIAYE